MKHFPKKSLGQHFLTDRNMIVKIVKAIDAQPSESLIEIGPGEGALTHELLKTGCSLTSLELDTALAKQWQAMAGKFPKFTCIETDATQADWLPYLPVDKCVGNIPYNVSRSLIYKVLQYRDKIGVVLFMVQKEFAEKLIAGLGEEAYGILSVLSQIFASVDLLFSIPPSVFYPPPKVMSACVKLTFKDIAINDALLIDVVQTAFNQRRKTLRNSLKKFYSADIEDQFDWEKRADQLSPDDYIQLVKILSIHK